MIGFSATIELSKLAPTSASKAALATAGLVMTTLAMGASNVGAVTLSPNLTIAGNDAAGATFNITAPFAATDVIFMNVSGSVAANNLGLAFANAAGNPVSGGNTGGNVTVGGGTFPAASLLVSANGTNFFRLFDASSGNNTNLARNTTIGAIFGTGLAAGTTLTFRVADFAGNYSDNLGAFNFSGTIATVPEPFTVIGTILGGTAAIRMRKKLMAAK